MSTGHPIHIPLSKPLRWYWTPVGRTPADRSVVGRCRFASLNACLDCSDLIQLQDAAEHIADDYVRQMALRENLENDRRDLGVDLPTKEVVESCPLFTISMEFVEVGNDVFVHGDIDDNGDYVL